MLEQLKQTPIFGGTLLLATLMTAGTLAAQELGWPREIEVPQAKVVIYQPQADSFEGNLLTGRAAVSVTPTGKNEPVFGAVWMKSRVATDRDNRTVEVLDIEVSQVRFPDATPEQEQSLSNIIVDELKKWDLTMSLDRLLTMLDLAEERRSISEGFNDSPPRILFVSHPVTLITIDGEPQLRSIENTGLQHVVNTPFLIVYESPSKYYYLYAGSEVWYISRQIDGPWFATSTVPSPVKALAPVEEEQEGLRRAEENAKELSEEGEAPPEEEFIVLPSIIVATEPTELIVSDGEPKYDPMADSGLLSMSNTESDVLLEVETQHHFVLLSGRWFTGPSLEGPWTFVASDALPEGFQKIPADSDMGHLRVWVAGTDEAKEAVLDSQIPQTSAVNRNTTIEVTYDGNPRFENIEGTEVAYAVNSTFSVLHIKGKYYCAHEGVWFVANEPLGPWSVADSVPKEEIDSIPASNPTYNTKYLHIYDSTPQVVHVGYYPGYTYSYVHHGCVVYGTGWYYRPYWGPHYYYPRPATWGFHARWNPWWGWSSGFSHSTGGFTFGIGFGGWGGWHRGGWWGPARYRPYYRGYHRGYHQGLRAGYRAGRVDRRIRNQNIYNRQNNVARNARVHRTPGARTPSVQRQGSNNVYADRNGTIHRRTQNGWQQRNQNSWSNGPGSQNLQRAHNSRQRGTTRSQSYQRSGAQRSGAQRSGARRSGGRRR